MAIVLARKNFPLEPLATVPAVFSSVLQNIIGGLLAAYWRARPVKTGATEGAPDARLAESA
jgi:BASS family bile acid:Na+ symporter